MPAGRIRISFFSIPYCPRSPEGILGLLHNNRIFATKKPGFLPVFSSLPSSYNVKIGMLIPFSFNFTNCSCTSSSKRIRSCARGETRVTFPLPKRVAKPCLKASRRLPDPKWRCGSTVINLLKHVKYLLSSPIGILPMKYGSLIVIYSLIRLFLCSVNYNKINCG